MGAALRCISSLVVLTVALPAWGQEPPKAAKSAKARVDLYGDPLPDGALARLGSVRFRHAGAVHSVAFSADGKLLAASSDDVNKIVVWDRATGKEVREIHVAGGGVPGNLRFSPDGKRIYGQLSTLFPWSVETGMVARDIRSPPPAVYALWYAPDMREVILLKDNEFIRWDIEKGKELGRYPRPKVPQPQSYVGAVAWVDGRLLVPHFDGKAVGMWDMTGNKQLWSVEATRDKNYPVLPRTFSVDGKLFAVETPPGAISIYEAVSGKRVQRLEGDGKVYYSLCFSPDGATIAGSSWGGSVRLWDLQAGRERARTPQIQGSVTNISFAPDSKTFATGGPNNAHAVMLWETATGKPIEPFPGHASPISCVAFSPDGRSAATSSWIRGDPVVRLWDLETGRPLRSFTALDAGGVSAVAFAPDGKTLAGVSWYSERKVRIWDVDIGRERHALAGHEAGCTCVAFSPDGARLASGDSYYNRNGRYEGRLCIWDTKAGKLIREVRGTDGAIQRVRFSGDGRQILVGANGVHVYDSDSGQSVGPIFQNQADTGRVWGLALSADGRLLATAGNGTARLWEVATRREIPFNFPDKKSYSVDLSPDGRTLAAISHDEGVLLCHWPSGETRRLSEGSRFGRGVYFAPDGRRLITTWNAESAALVWDVAGLLKKTLPAVAKPAEADLKRWWEELGDDSPATGYKAVWRFAAARDQALPFLARSLRPVKTYDPKLPRRLIDELDSPSFAVRQRAMGELERLGDAVFEPLRKARQGASLEQIRRIDKLLSKLTGAPDAEQLRGIRAVATLEQIGGPEAKKILSNLLSGAPGARLTADAKASLERLKRGEK